MATDNVIYDVDGYEVLTQAILALINQYPALTAGDSISFSTLDEDKGKAMFADSGAIVRREVVSITDHVTQTCQYPFSVIYRAGGLNERRKIAVKKWLDDFGKWLEKQPITVDGTEYKLSIYPTLNDGREIKSINRTTPAVLYNLSANNVEDWLISMQVVYEYEFDR